MELRFAKWEVSYLSRILINGLEICGVGADFEGGQNGKQGDNKNLHEANARDMAEHQHGGSQ